MLELRFLILHFGHVRSQLLEKTPFSAAPATDVIY